MGRGLATFSNREQFDMMRKYFLALIAAAILAPQVGRCAVLQAVGFDCGHVTTCTIGSGQGWSATTANSTVVFLIAYGGGTISNATVGANSSTTADKNIAGGGGGNIAIFSVHGIAGGVTSVSVTLSATEWVCVIVAEESGLSTSANLDQANATAGAGGQITWNSGNVTTTQASEVAYGYAYYPASTTQTMTPDAGWSKLSGTGIDANGGVFETTDGLAIYGVRQVLSSTGTYANSGTAPNGQYTAGIATYKVASGGSCTHSGQAKNGSVSVPNGSTGSYWGKSGGWVTPDCSTVQYWSPAAGNFVVN